MLTHFWAPNLTDSKFSLCSRCLSLTWTGELEVHSKCSLPWYRKGREQGVQAPAGENKEQGQGQGQVAGSFRR